jgi:hypothetical protein
MIKYSQLSNEEWLSKQIKHKPLRQIAEEVGCSYSAVVYASRRFNIKVPHRNKHRFADKSEAIKKSLKKRFPDGRYGEKSSNWKGGKRKVQGYTRLYMPGHHLAIQGAVFEHRLVAENTLGRRLKKDEVVHHINGIKDDNRPENLQVLKRGEHVKHHYTDSEGLQKLYKRIEYLENLLSTNHIQFDKL